LEPPDPRPNPHEGELGETGVVDAALAWLRRPALWLWFAVGFAALLAALLAAASGGGAGGSRFDYDLF
jgi:hypothetical protein